MDYEDARYRMVQHQLRTNRVTDAAILSAMGELPRERFVPDSLRSLAYIDEDVPLGNGRVLIEPLATAWMLQAAQIGAGDVVLEIGSGTGYTVAVIARIASAAVGLESDPQMAERAAAVLAELGLTNASIVTGPLQAGWPEQAPYDVIVFGGAVALIPPPIVDQLAEGGRLVAVVAQGKGMGVGTLLLRRNGIVSRRPIFDAAVPLLPEFSPQPAFRF